MAGVMLNTEPPRPRGTKPCVPQTAGKEGTPSQHHGPSGHSCGCAWGVSAGPSGMEADGVAGNMLPASDSVCLLAKGCVSASCPWDGDQLCFPPVRLVWSYSHTRLDWLERTSGVSFNLLFRAGLASELQHVVLGLIQVTTEYLQGWRYPSPWCLLQGCTALTGKKLLLISNWNFPYCSSCPLPLVLLPDTSGKSLAPSSPPVR